jgi:putative ABC transport system permease protein
MTKQMSPTAWVHIVGRLKPGMDIANATAQLATLPPGRGTTGVTFGLTGVNTAALAERVRPDMARFARLLTLTVGLLLLIGCLTVGMLLLLRTEARRDEFAMCLALGATRGRLSSGIMLEGALLSCAGTMLALPVSLWLLAGVRAFQLPGRIDISLIETPIDGRLFTVAAAAAIMATLVIAIVGGVFGFSADVTGALRARAGSTPRIGRRRTRSALIVAQVATALVLLVGAGLFIRSLSASLSLNPGYDTSRIAKGDIGLATYGYSPEQSAAFFDELLERLSHAPAIRSVATDYCPGGMGGGGSLVMDGEAREVPSFVQYHYVDEHYLSTMGLPVVRGRNFSVDDRAGAPSVAIVTQSLGRFLAHGGDPIGHHIAEFFNRPGQPPGSIEVIGVVPDIITSVTTLEPLKLYLPLAQASASQNRTVLLRASGDASLAVNEARSAIKSMVPAMAVLPQFTTIDEVLGKEMSPQRFGATVLGALGAIAVLLTLFGTYVLTESMSAIRRREMGVRAALGASRRQLSALVLGETARLIAFGLGAGLLLVWLGAGVIRSFLFGVQPLDPSTLAIVTMTMLALALVVSVRPALRAARVDLARVLREE